jgi:predicted nucleotidyltransferase component of viral defense system
MDKKIREAQLHLLDVFSKASRTFALAGGTALELFYLKHRFSRDLDFFSPKFDLIEIDELVSKFEEVLGKKIELDHESLIQGKAKLRFYTVKVKGTSVPLKIDFIEDVIFEKPRIRRFKGIPVYDVEEIYYQKILTLVGARLGVNDIGKEIITGRGEARDVVDVYYLSKKICPLHKFVKRLPSLYKRGLIYWYRTYSRYDLKVACIDLDIYDKEFDILELIRHFDAEICKIVEEEI